MAVGWLGKTLLSSSAGIMKKGWGLVQSTGTFIKVGLGIGAADTIVNGKESVIGGAADNLWTDIGKIEAEQNAIAGWHGFLKSIQEFLNIIGIKWGYLDEKLKTHGEKDNNFTKIKDDITQNGQASNLDIAVRTIGTPVSELTGIDKTIAGYGTAGTYAAYKGGKYAVNKFKGGGKGPTNTGGGNDPKNGDGGKSTKNAERTNADKAWDDITGKDGQTNSFDDATKKKGFFSKALSGANSLGSKLIKRLPVIGAVATATIATTSAAKASQAADSFQKAADDMSPAQRIEASNSIATQEQALGGDLIGGAAATAGGLGAAFFLASNPAGWATTAVIGTSVAVGFAAQAIGDNITVDDKGTSLSQWTGNKVSNAFSAAADKASDLTQSASSKLNTAFTNAKNWLSGEEAKPEAIRVKSDNTFGKNVFDGTPFTSNAPF